MYLQQEVQLVARDLTGCDSELQMYKTILKAIPLTKINHQIVQDGILNCISILSGHFTIRAVVCDNHSTNVSAYKTP